MRKEEETKRGFFYDATTFLGARNCCGMDFFKSTMAVYDRIEKIEPVLVSQIVGYLWLKGYRDKDMIRLAFGPDALIESVVQECKDVLPSFKASLDQMVGSHISSRHGRCLPPLCHTPFLSLSYQSLSWDPQFLLEQLPAVYDFDFAPPPYSYTVGNGQYVNLEEHSNHADYTTPILPNNFHYHESNPDPRTRRRCISLPEVTVKSCNYYYKGYCKHNNRCRYLHGETSAEGHSGIKESASDDYTISTGSLDKLEVELIELLKCRGGRPIPIAMLPMLYNDKYGMTLQGSGYLTDSQRHGKSGCSLKKLLSSLNSIRILERPHGQHSIVLAEDFPSCLMNWDKRTGHGNVVSGSLQIYLTFPAESTFTEIDISNYFMRYGHVQAVRIPAQQKRMFGFVSFVRVDTVETILLRPNPHYICCSRVLVKPYREKTRKYGEYPGNTVDSSLKFLETNTGLRSISRAFSTSRLLREQLTEESKLEVQAKHLSELQLAPMPFAFESYLSNKFHYRGNTEASDGSINALKIENRNMSAERSFPNCDSDQIVLPENPFASTVAGSNTSLK